MVRPLILAAALVAAGCTTLDLDDAWSKPGGSVIQMSRDDWECRREIYATAPRTVDLYVGGLADTGRVLVDDRLQRFEYARCMRARGYENTRG